MKDQGISDARSPVKQDIFELARLRSSVEDWVKKSAQAVWDFRREGPDVDGSFWKDSKAVEDPGADTPRGHVRPFRNAMPARKQKQLSYMPADVIHPVG
jgi:hypothetical protein